MRLYHWRPAGGLENLGDWLSLPLLRALGLSPRPHEPGEPCVFAVGSILHPTHYRACRSPRVTVWGSGCSAPGHEVPPGVALDVWSVRGPLTRDAMGLPTPTPLGDLATLAPRLLPLPAVESGGLVYVPHCGSPQTNPGWADAVAPTLVSGETGLASVARIAAADYVATESLHGAILAHAYGVPWEPVSPTGRVGPSFKWADWCAFLGRPAFRAFPPTPAGGTASGRRP